MRLSLAELSRVVPGLYAWLATVALPALERGASSWARLPAVVALGVLLASSAIGASRPRLARWLGVQGFAVCCLVAWSLLSRELASDSFDPVRGAFGALGFLLHALAWGAPHTPEATEPARVVPGAHLVARARPSALAPPALGVAVLLALLAPALAFGARNPSAALLAHAVALGCAVLSISAAGAIVLRFGRPLDFPAWRIRGTRAIWSLSLLSLALGAGLLWAALH
jgi:hypothetical protein